MQIVDEGYDANIFFSWEFFQISYLSEQSHETRGRHHADLPCQRLSDGRPTLLLTAAVRVRLEGKEEQTITLHTTSTTDVFLFVQQNECNQRAF